jgi:hypothetical protein
MPGRRESAKQTGAAQAVFHQAMIATDVKTLDLDA